MGWESEIREGGEPCTLLVARLDHVFRTHALCPFDSLSRPVRLAAPANPDDPMRKPASMKALEELGRVRLSEHFFMREMLYSEIANFHGVPNIPDDRDLAIAAGMRLCEELLEPLHATFGHVSIHSAFRSVEVNTYGAERQDKGYNCGKTAWNHSRHVWDRRDAEPGRQRRAA